MNPSLRAPAKQSRTEPAPVGKGRLSTTNTKPPYRLRNVLVRNSLAALALTVFLPAAQAAPPGNCGTIVYPGDSVTSFSPLLADTEANARASSFLYLGLIWVNRFAQIDWQRSLASAISTPDNGQTYNVTLRPWHWSDGVAVTTADVALAYKLIKQYGTAYPDYGAGGIPYIIKTFNLIDPTHFQVVLTRRVNTQWFIFNGLSQFQPMPAHVWAGTSIDQITQLQSTPSFFKIVDGPMKLQRFDVGQDAIFTPNPAYEGPPMHFNRFVFKFLQSDGAAVQQMESGELDLTGVPMPLWNSVQHLPGVHLQTIAPGSFFYFIQMDLANPAVAFFRDARVRDAMADALDQQAMIRLVFHNHGSPVYGPFTPANARFLAPQLQAGHYPVGYNPQQSRALLAQAGFTPGPDGIMRRQGKKLSFTLQFSTGDEETTQMVEMFQAQFRAVGIDMRLSEVEFNDMIQKIEGPATWQAVFFGNTVGGFPSGEFNFETGAFDNTSHYSDKKMDRLIDASVNQPGLNGLYAYELYAAAQQPEIFTAEPQRVFLVNNRLHGVNEFDNPAGALAPDQLYCTAGTTE